MSPRAEQLRDIARRMIMRPVVRNSDLDTLVVDVLALDRIADEVERIEERARPWTRRERDAHRALRRIKRAILRTFHPRHAGG